MADYGFDTLSIHAGAQPDPATGARATPIYQTTSFVFEDADHAAALFNLQVFGNIYSRIMNPTNAVLEERIAALENGRAGLAVASGHAAQFIVFHTLMSPGDEIVAARQLYGGSINQFSQGFAKFDWHVKWADTRDPESFRKALSAEDESDLRRKPRQSRRHRHRHRSDRRRRERSGRAAHRRQHAGLALPHPPDRMGRGHRRPFGHEIPRRPRQLHGRLDRRRRQVRLGQRQISDAVGALPVLSRHAHVGDVRRHGLRHHLPRAGLARPRPRAVADERVPHFARHRDAAAAHAAPLRQRARRRALAQDQRQGRVGELRGARRQIRATISTALIRRKAPARSSPSA